MSYSIPKRITIRLDDEERQQIVNYMENNGLNNMSKVIRSLIQRGLSMNTQTLYNGDGLSDTNSRSYKLCGLCGEPATHYLHHKGQTFLVCDLHVKRHGFKEFGIRKI